MYLVFLFISSDFLHTHETFTLPSLVPSQYLNVLAIVGGVALFMGGGDSASHKSSSSSVAGPSQVVGLALLFVSLCFDGGTGAYEDKLMSTRNIGPFDLMVGKGGGGKGIGKREDEHTTILTLLPSLSLSLSLSC